MSDQAFTDKLKELLKYKKLRALHEGDIKFTCENGLLVVERKTSGQTAVLLVNNTDKALSARGINVAANSYKITVE